jgi:hypothetical protein|tara:strand:- start:172 stop:348 length:177 start_codon:yes stop_codon:yes gene_type:complete
MQLSRPLDFVAITDHAEGFGSRTHCDDADLSWSEGSTGYNLWVFQMIDENCMVYWDVQ